MKPGRTLQASDATEQLRSSLRELLGENGASALEHHLRRRLEGDVYQAFFEHPNRFYRALSAFMGVGGADAILRILAHHLIEKELLRDTAPDEFLALLKDGSEEAAIRLRALFSRGSKPPK